MCYDENPLFSMLFCCHGEIVGENGQEIGSILGVLKESSRLRWKVGINGEFLEWSKDLWDFVSELVENAEKIGFSRRYR